MPVFRVFRADNVATIRPAPFTRFVNEQAATQARMNDEAVLEFDVVVDNPLSIAGKPGDGPHEWMRQAHHEKIITDEELTWWLKSPTEAGFIALMLEKGHDGLIECGDKNEESIVIFHTRQARFLRAVKEAPEFAF